MKNILLIVFVFMASALLFAGTPSKAELNNGKTVFNKICFACHKDGVAGAAAITNKKRWQENADKGIKKLVSSVKSGVTNGKYGTMPPKGGCMDCSEKDIHDAILFMINESGAKLK
ncbi:MAG TPA: cytochrome c5 family protein [Caldithrix abyssi]|uniref:Cytochrome c5 family protein n=1 Tax=Caldithrix abyssi TaxID=187145 RepID=A0A7V1M0B5_CALAY|nr:cytochrome c5 family protein [Caldithrix abyssi]